VHLGIVPAAAAQFVRHLHRRDPRSLVPVARFLRQGAAS